MSGRDFRAGYGLVMFGDTHEIQREVPSPLSLPPLFIHEHPPAKPDTQPNSYYACEIL
jgi:hypothetical protein